MQDKFRLRKDVCHLFSRDKTTQVKNLEAWRKDNICEEILERVEAIRVILGHERPLEGGGTMTTNSGWESDGQKAKFHFTIEVNGVTNRQYEKIDKRELMDEIQFAINAHLSQKIEE